MKMQIIDGKLLPVQSSESDSTKHDPSQILQEVEMGLWTLIKPYAWKCAIGIVFSLLGTLSFFSLRNSQNSYKIANLEWKLQNLQDQFWNKNEENRNWKEQKDREITEYKTRIINLEKLEERWYKSHEIKE